MAVTFQTERFADVRHEAEALAQAHWEEVEAPLYGAREYHMDFEQYEKLDAAGLLHIVTARDGGRMVGYASFFATYNMHLGGMLATLDGLFLDKAYRGAGGIKLLRFAADAVRACGAVAAQFSSPASKDCGALYRRLGAKLTETVYTLRF
ncbi:MAG: GNAT family N-acetyltransferase [Desulfovibrio sp.]|uniref:GNAT family N-acetyltransferase n=1 Tax=Desulfovibrio sp. TaxID=885 RepID=UPI002582C0A8|nr:GNAT family N-acetyltransferase [Desulfovibrio sp.]MCD7984886.1 GNAT family N-acetyltransferase [Desulfovibrio sp.]